MYSFNDSFCPIKEKPKYYRDSEASSINDGHNDTDDNISDKESDQPKAKVVPRMNLFNDGSDHYMTPS